MDSEQAERQYYWLEAAESYKQMPQFKTDDPSSAAFWGKLGYYYQRASRQAETRREFKKLSRQGFEAYEKAARLLEKSGLHNQGKTAEYLSAAKYLSSLISSSSSIREKMLAECKSYGKMALAAYKAARDELNYGKTANMLSFCLSDRLFLAHTLEEKEVSLREALDNAEDAVATCSKLDEKDELLFALSAADLLLCHLSTESQREEEQKEIVDRGLAYTERVIELSAQVGNPYSKAVAMWAATLSNLYFSGKIEASLEYANEMLKQGSLLRDAYFKGIASFLLAYINFFRASTEADQAKKKEEYEDVIRYAKDSVGYLQLISEIPSSVDSYMLYVDSYCSLALEFAFKPSEKLSLLKRAVKIGEKGLEWTKRSGYSTGSVLHALSKALWYSAKLEARDEKKTVLLENALDFRKKANSVTKTFSKDIWNSSVGLIYSAQIEADLAKLQKDERTKTTFLKDALTDIEIGVLQCNNVSKSLALPWMIAAVANFEDTWGRMLNEYYSLSKNKESLLKANKVFSDASEKFRHIELPNRVAESYWTIGRNLDSIGDCKKAAENFENAFVWYKAAAQKISQFSDFYLDYASYMKAWSKIQFAKYAHGLTEYADAMQHYEQASDLLSQSKSWRHLSRNFQAWAHFELAEDYSRKENCREAINSFEKTIKLFQESERTLEVQLKKIDRVDEKNFTKQLVQAAARREDYCQARIQIEEAKILDKQGNHAKSSEKYEAAAADFERISQIDTEQTLKETQPLIYLSKAWQKMTMAEARNSSTLYEEAAKLFEQANDYTMDESASLLALGHSSFCKALKAGTEFESTRKTTMLGEAKGHMESAADCYLKAGFEAASEYAKAMQRLFDAYVFMANAKQETDPEKQARQYFMSEKVLQKSVEAFSRAEQAERIRQVQKLMEKVRDERELALSLSEVLHAPTITSSTASFVTIGPIEEDAVGLERFEHGDVQGKIIQYGENVTYGEEANFGIQMINVGKEPVFLIRIANILPKNFQLTQKPDSITVEDGDLIVKGKRLEPLKTSEIGFTFKPFGKADVEIKPKIICVDETGRQLFTELEPKILHISETVLPGRIASGFEDLDSLLLGGIPENYAVILISPSCDERDTIINKFLETGARKNQVTYCVMAEPRDAIAQAEQFPSSLYIFLCDPRAGAIAKGLPNVFSFKGVENLTDINIALTKAFRSLDQSRSGPKRACIEIVSDVLLQHRALITRKWLSGLLSDLRAKGFTTIAVINPHMHPSEEAQSIMGLFEGTVEISEKETEDGLERILRIRRLRDQRYLENEIVMEKSRNT